MAIKGLLAALLVGLTTPLMAADFCISITDPGDGDFDGSVEIAAAATGLAE